MTFPSVDGGHLVLVQPLVGDREATGRGRSRRDGKVGSPNSSDRPSAVRPRSTVPKAHSAIDAVAPLIVGRCTRRR